MAYTAKTENCGINWWATYLYAAGRVIAGDLRESVLRRCRDQGISCNERPYGLSMITTTCDLSAIGYDPPRPAPAGSLSPPRASRCVQRRMNYVNPGPMRTCMRQAAFPAEDAGYTSTVADASDSPPIRLSVPYRQAAVWTRYAGTRKGWFL